MGETPEDFLCRMEPGSSPGLEDFARHVQGNRNSCGIARAAPSFNVAYSSCRHQSGHLLVDSESQEVLEVRHRHFNQGQRAVQFAESACFEEGAKSSKA